MASYKTLRAAVATVGLLLGFGSAHAAYWSLFNLEGESSLAADYVTYATLTDMLTDSNRLDVFTVGGFGRNIVGSGSDADVYWSLFNLEGESSLAADYVTYATLTDMLTDSNRLDVFTVGGFGRNIVGSGSDGDVYWSLFNLEGESSLAADYVTYATLTDMLTDSNRLDVFTVGGFGRNIVGTGSDELRGPNGGGGSVPEPASLMLVLLALLALALHRRGAPARL